MAFIQSIDLTRRNLVRYNYGLVVVAACGELAEPEMFEGVDVATTDGSAAGAGVGVLGVVVAGLATGVLVATGV